MTVLYITELYASNDYNGKLYMFCYHIQSSFLNTKDKVENVKAPGKTI